MKAHSQHLLRCLPGFRRAPAQRGSDGFSIIEMLVYMTVLLAILAVGFAALYRSMDNSSALRGSTDDIAKALQAGETWRTDVRNAVTWDVDSAGENGQILQLSGPRGNISYKFVDNTLFRRIADNEWSPVLSNVQTSLFVADQRARVMAWRWELELQPRRKKLYSVKPLFTFIAVPRGASTK